MRRLRSTAKYNKTSYKIVNLVLIVLFSVGFFYVSFTEDTLHCFYQKNYGVACPTCGLTRDFRQLLSLEFTPLINPISVNYFFSILMLYSTRFLSLSLLYKEVRIKWIFVFDVVVVFVAFGILWI